MYKIIKGIICIFASCPECYSSNVREESSYDGYTHYTCRECCHSWTE